MLRLIYCADIHGRTEGLIYVLLHELLSLLQKLNSTATTGHLVIN